MPISTPFPPAVPPDFTVTSLARLPLISSAPAFTFTGPTYALSLESRTTPLPFLFNVPPPPIRCDFTSSDPDGSDASTADPRTCTVLAGSPIELAPREPPIPTQGVPEALPTARSAAGTEPETP